MYKMTKRLNILVLIALLSCILSLSCNEHKTGIKHGEGFLSKFIFFEGDIPFGVLTIQVCAGGAPHGKEVAILGKENGYVIETETGALKRKLRFKHSVGLRPEILDKDCNGSMKIVDRGGGFGDVGLADMYGDFIWKYGKVGTSPAMVSADLDRDDKVEFYVADYDGLHRLDLNGKQVWKAGDIWEEAIAVYDKGDRFPFVVTAGERRIRFWDSSGKLIKDIVPEVNIFQLDLIEWHDDIYILSAFSSDIILMDLKGKIHQHYKAGEDLGVNAIRGVTVRFDRDTKPYLAMLTDFPSRVNKTMLTIISPDEQVVYRELLDSTRGIAVLADNDGSESLLVGDGERKVWMYQREKR
jgi:hypothetical protein